MKKKNSSIFRTLFIVGPAKRGELGFYALLSDDGYLMAGEYYESREEARKYLITGNPDMSTVFAHYLKGGFNVCYPRVKQAFKLKLKNSRFSDPDFEKRYIEEHGLQWKEFKEVDI